MSVCSGSVHWGRSPLAFALSSSEPTLLARAATILRPWRSSQPVAPAYHWWVEPIRCCQLESRTRWELRSDRSLEVRLLDTPERALATVEFSAVQALVECPEGPLSLHGALVARNGQGVVILGHSYAGKSTLACALWQRGWLLLCDDVTLVAMDQGLAWPTPRRVSLRSSSQPLLGADLWARIRTTPACDRSAEGWLFHPDEVDGQVRPDAIPLAGVVFLARRDRATSATRLERLPPAHALLALLPYSNIVRRLDPGEAIRRLRPLAETVPAYDLDRGPLDAMVQEIERTFEGGS